VHSPDLFGFVPVSLSELELWLFTVPRMEHTRRGRAAYIRNYEVVRKIQRAKLDGSLDSIFGNCQCEFCGNPLIQEQTDLSPPVSPTDELTRLRRRVQVLEFLLIIPREVSASFLPRGRAHPQSV
jgi:hypothetical protein